MEFTRDDLILLYRNMVRGWAYDMRMVEMCRRAQVPGMWHSGHGHEAVGAGIATFLRKDDWLEFSHRGFTCGLAKGVEGKKFFAEHLCRVGGYSRGKGSHEFPDRGIGILPYGKTIGSAFPIATGAGIAAQRGGKEQVVVCLFGDGAAQRGTMHESMNMAGVWNLPIVWVCENNLYSIDTHVNNALATEDISDFAHPYKMPGVIVDGQDVLAVAEATMDAVEKARKGGGPSLIECKTYRYRDHGEFERLETRPPEEIEEWKIRDPVVLFRTKLLSDGTATEEELDAIEAEVKEEVAEAAEWALAQPTPPIEETYTDLFKE